MSANVKSTIFVVATFLAVTVISCIDEHYFGKSDQKRILYFTVEGQLGSTQIIEDSLKIYVKVSPDADLTSVTADSILLSTFAHVEPDVGAAQDFSKTVWYTVTAEDGTSVDYQVIVKREGLEPQLDNSGFDLWYTPKGKGYKQPGSDAATIWATANDGVTTMGADNFNTTPELVAGTDYLARLETKDLGPLAQITGQRIGSATLFTGRFELNLSDPPSSAIFGTTFVARPKSFSVDLHYHAGSPYKNGNNETLDKTDSADVYVLLENRTNPNSIERIATGWYRMRSSEEEEMANVTVELLYGPLPPDAPAYQKPTNNLYGEEDAAVTHITVVFASSAYGINYEGGVGSTLKVNNFRLNYE